MGCIIMKKLSVILSIILLLSIVSIFSIESDIKPIDSILAEIRTEQGLKGTDKINPDKVSPKLLEELGDSVMEQTIGNHDRHEQMDSMMGGDGSDSLTSMHQGIGYSYLTGNLNGMGMMGYGNMMGNNANYKFSNRGRNMMGNYGYNMMGFGGGWIAGIVLLILFLGLIGSVIFLIIRTSKKTNSVSDSAKPLEILKTRYAKGDITKDDYEKIKKDIEI
jgi:putative membrane protein